MDQQGTFAARMIDSALRAYAIGALERQQGGSGAGFSDFEQHCLVDPVADTCSRLMHLAESLATGRRALLDDFLAWTKIGHAARGGSDEAVLDNLSAIRDELGDRLPAASAATCRSYLEEAMVAFRSAPAEAPSVLDDGGPHADLTRRFLLAMLEARREDAIDLVSRAMDGGVSAAEIYRDVITAAQEEVGRLWQIGKIDVSEEHLGSRIVESVLHGVSARVPAPASDAPGVVVACVAGNLHQIGARMVSDHFALAGWRPIFIGADVPAASIAIALRDFGADLVALSVHMTLQVRESARVIATIRELDLGIPILVGGRPFGIVPDLWKVVGADAGAGRAEQAPAAAEGLSKP